MKGIIKKFKDYLQSVNQDEKEPTDPRTLKLEDITVHFQLLADTAMDVVFDKSQFSLPDTTDKDPRKLGHINYPCVYVTYYFGKDDDFDKLAKYADRAATIYESETEFTVYVEEGDNKEYNPTLIGDLDNDFDLDVTEKKVGKTITITIFNKRLKSINV